MMCEQCGADKISAQTLDIYPDKGLIGLPNIVLVKAVQKRVCQECGAENGISIPDLEGLEAAVAVARIGIPVKLNANEVRFLRKALGIRAKELAEILEVREETISRWENGKETMGPQYEKLLRFLVGYALHEKAPGIDFNEEAVLRMRIPAVTDLSKQHVPMTFKRVEVRVNRRERRETWESGPSEKIAASG